MPNKAFLNPFSEDFMPVWEYWKKYKKEQFRFSYKPIGEQAAIDDLFELSDGNEALAKQIIKQSIVKGWQGLFAIKPININQNGQQQQNSNAATRQSLNDLYNQRFGTGR